jgi:FkbM family methyltransferase
MYRALYVKHRVIGSPVERTLEQLRWMAGSGERLRHPELAGFYREFRYVGVALRHLVQPNFSCIDGGAHIGSVLSKFVRLSPGGHHMAIEPVPFKADWLRRRYPHADVREVAISDEPGRFRFYEDRKRPGYSGLRMLDGAFEVATYDVDVARLDDLVGDREFQLVKLVLEGAELPALRGAERLLERCRPILLFECGVPSALELFGYERTDVWDFLHTGGYDVYLARDVVFGREPIGRDEFRRAGTYPFPGFKFIALAAGTPVTRLC